MKERKFKVLCKEYFIGEEPKEYTAFTRGNIYEVVQTGGHSFRIFDNQLYEVHCDEYFIGDIFKCIDFTPKNVKEYLQRVKIKNKPELELRSIRLTGNSMNEVTYIIKHKRGEFYGNVYIEMEEFKVALNNKSVDDLVVNKLVEFLRL